MHTTDLIAAIQSGLLVTPYAAATRLGQPLQSVLQAIRTGRVPSIQHPLYIGRVLVRLDDVAKWAEKKHPTQGKRTDLTKRRKNAT
jgi:hypothetical protein